MKIDEDPYDIGSGI